MLLNPLAWKLSCLQDSKALLLTSCKLSLISFYNIHLPLILVFHVALSYVCLLFSFTRVYSDKKSDLWFSDNTIFCSSRLKNIFCSQNLLDYRILDSDNFPSRIWIFSISPLSFSIIDYISLSFLYRWFVIFFLQQD